MHCAGDQLKDCRKQNQISHDCHPPSRFALQEGIRLERDVAPRRLCAPFPHPTAATLSGDRNIAVGESSRSCPILVYPPFRPCRYLAYPSCTPCRYLARLWRSCRMVRRHPCGRRRNEAPPPLWRVASAVHPPPTTGGFGCALSSATGGCFFGGWFPLRAIPFPIKPLTSKNVKMPPRG